MPAGPPPINPHPSPIMQSLPAGSRRTRLTPALAAVAMLAAVGLLAGCTASGGSIPAGSTDSRPLSSSPAQTTPTSPSAGARPTVAACRPTGQLTRPAGLTSRLPLVTLAAGLTGADDLLARPDGVGGSGDRVLVGSLTTGRITELGGPDGPTRLPVRLPGVEGMAWLDGALYAADQPRDRVVRVGADGSVRTVLQLRPVPGLEGIDGLGTDGTNLLVPDSPRGQVLIVDRAGRVLRTIGGFARPTGVWPLPGGAMLVADENAGTVVRVAPGGSSRTILARDLPGADDVVAGPDGTVWSIGISGGVLVRLADGRAEPVVSGFAHPQGLGVDGAGNLIVADLGTGIVTKVITSFALPPAQPVTLGAGQPLCVSVLRAPGFTGAVTLTAGSGAKVLTLPGTGTVGVVLPQPCAASCSVLVRATSGSLKVSVLLGYRTR